MEGESGKSAVAELEKDRLFPLYEFIEDSGKDQVFLGS